MRTVYGVIIFVGLMFLFGCNQKMEDTNQRDEVLTNIENQQTELNEIFDNEIALRNEYRQLENPNLIRKQEYIDNIDLLAKKRAVIETNLAENLRSYYLKFKDESAYSTVLSMYVRPKIEIIHNLKDFQSEIVRKHIINEMLEEYKKGNVQDKQILKLFDDFKNGKNTKFVLDAPIDSESTILYSEVFNKQYTMLEEFIGEHLSVLKKYFGDFEEVREIDNEIVRPYYKRLISSLPSNSTKLSALEKRVLNDHLQKMIKLFPYSDLAVKAEQKLIPLTAKKELSELFGAPLIFFLVILTLITAGYTFCMRGFLRNKQPEIIESRIFKPFGSNQFPKVDSDFSLQSPLDKED